MTLVYTSPHEDLSKLEVLTRVKKQVPWLSIDRGEAGRLVFMAIVHSSLCLCWSSAMWVVLSDEFINCRADRRAKRLIQMERGCQCRFGR